MLAESAHKGLFLDSNADTLLLWGKNKTKQKNQEKKDNVLKSKGLSKVFSPGGP